MPQLEQREGGRDLVLLRDYPHRVVRLDCLHCDGTGRSARKMAIAAAPVAITATTKIVISTTRTIIAMCWWLLLHRPPSS